MNFNDGGATDGFRSFSYGHVRLVRGRQFSALLTTPSSDFIDHGDGTVTHKRTNLSWKRCAEGATWTGSTCSGNASTYTYDQAVALTSNFAGQSDWRLPNVQELLSIVEYGAFRPAINAAIFPATPSLSFWSASAYAGDSNVAWYVYFFTGNANGNYSRSTGIPVRLVRGGQSSALLSTAVNGACGAAHGTSLTAAPTINLCLTGTPSSVTGSGPWSWTCQGSGGGSTASCQASPLQLTGISFGQSSLSPGASTTIFASPTGAALGSCTSSNPQIAAVNGDMVFAGSTPGTVTISCNGRSATLTVIGPQLAGLAIEAPVTSMLAGSSITLTATARYSDGTSRPVRAQWSASSSLVRIDGEGQLSAGSGVTAAQTVTVTARYTEGGRTLTASFSLSVMPAAGRLTALSIQGNAQVPSGGSLTLRAIAGYADGTTQAVSPVWRSSLPALVSVDANGSLRAGSVTTDTLVTLTAEYAENGVTVSQTFSLTVKKAVTGLTSLTVAGPREVQAGQSVQLSATAQYGDGRSRAVQAAWTSSNAALATVDGQGRVSAQAVNGDSQVLITATFAENGVSKTALFSLTVRASGATSASARAVPALAAGYAHMLALKSDGTLWSWGWSFLGQTGSGGAQTRSAPVQVALLDRVTAIAAGAAHNLALRSDGSVWAWGYNGMGGLGVGSGADRYTPVRVEGLPAAVAIAAGLGHSLALAGDGVLWAWGDNAAGQLGDGTTTARATPAAVEGLDGVVAIAASGQHSLAVKADGTVWAWGDNSAGQLGAAGRAAVAQPTPIGNLAGIKAIAAGNEHVLALDERGRVWAWGRNASGQLGNGSTEAVASPTRVPGLSNIVAIAAGVTHSVALANDGTVWAWGGNAQGQLGDGSQQSRLLPQPLADLTDVVAIAAGNASTAALRADGRLWTVGDNWLGQLGDGSFVGGRRYAPVQQPERRALFDMMAERPKMGLAAEALPRVFLRTEKAGDESLAALGSLGGIMLGAQIALPEATTRAGYELYAALLVPAGRPGLTPEGRPGAIVDQDRFFFRTPGGWQPFESGEFPAYGPAQGADAAQMVAISLIENTDLSRLSGAQFYVGYGRSAQEMIEAGRYRLVYRVP